MDVQFRKHVVVQVKFESRVSKKEEKLLWPNEKNLTDQVVLDLLS